MARKNNVNPDRYKTAGREPQGQSVFQDVERQKLGEEKARLSRSATSPVPGSTTEGEFGGLEGAGGSGGGPPGHGPARKGLHGAKDGRITSWPELDTCHPARRRGSRQARRIG